MKRYSQLIDEAREQVAEIMPWDLDEELQAGGQPLLVDVREPAEYAAMHIPGAINIPRGILETACEWGFDDTLPELVQARQRRVIVICRSGNRSLFAAQTMKILGYQDVVSLRTGVRGWNDSDLPLTDEHGQSVDGDTAEDFLMSRVRPDQMQPQ